MPFRNKFVISIHAPARGATRQNSAPQQTIGFQSTPPRGGRPCTSPSTPTLATISIHAPARGATQIYGPVQRQHVISIHAPARGATRSTDTKGGDRIYFNPRPREGGDGIRCITQHFSGYFNPRPREGGDSFSTFAALANISFQSTPPRGGRRHERRVHHPAEDISIHAPARGATASSTATTTAS